MRSSFFAFATCCGLLAASASAADPVTVVPNRRSHGDVKMETAITAHPIASIVEQPAALPPLPEGVEELSFQDFYKMPVGRYGLEPSERLMGMNGKTVRLTGYFVFEDWATCNCGPESLVPGEKNPRRRMPAWMKHVIPGRIMMASVPTTVSLGHYGLCDDLPPHVAFISVQDRFGEPVFYKPGLFSVIGKVEVGQKQELDGRVSFVRLVVEKEEGFLRAGQGVAAR